MREPPSETKYIPLSDASRRYGMSVNTIKGLARKGVLTLFRPTGVKVYVVSVEEMEAHFASSKVASP
jgi:hypothetical protein